MANYRLTVAISEIKDGFTTTVHLPSFVYEGNVLGIMSTEHAEHIAQSTFQQLLPHAGIDACAVIIPSEDRNA